MPSKKPLTPSLYIDLRNKLLERVPEARRAVNAAASDLPLAPLTEHNLAEEAALRFVEKPLYSWMKAKLGGLGDRYSHMWRQGVFPHYKVMAGPSWEIDMTYTSKADKNGVERKTAIFSARGEDVKRFRNEAGMDMPMPDYPLMKRPQVALKRLYLMRQIAGNLTHTLPAISAAREGFDSAVSPDDFFQYAKPVQDGLQVGLTTVFHGATDLGYKCIKPDIHAARSLGWFEQLDEDTENSGKDASALAFEKPLRYLTRDRNKCVVVSKAVGLARSLDADAVLPEFRGNACREVDIILMQASLHNAILEY